MTKTRGRLRISISKTVFCVAKTVFLDKSILNLGNDSHLFVRLHFNFLACVSVITEVSLIVFGVSQRHTGFLSKYKIFDVAFWESGAIVANFKKKKNREKRALLSQRTAS